MGRIKPVKVLREPPRRTKRGAVNEVAALLNLGPKTSAWLAAVDLTTREQVQALGPVEVCRRVRRAGHPVSVLLAYALEGALTGCHWNQIPFETKQWLRTEFAQMKRAETRSR